MNFGERLKIAREKSGLWQKDAAKLLNITSSQLSRYERNISSPIPEQIRKMAVLYNVSTDYLLGLEIKYSMLQGCSVIQENTTDYDYITSIKSLSTEKQFIVRQLLRFLAENTSET